MATAVMTSLRTKFLGKAEARVLFVGLDGGGKSTILYRLKNGTVNESEIIRAPRAAHPDAPRARRRLRARVLPVVQRRSASTASASSTARWSSLAGT